MKPILRYLNFSKVQRIHISENYDPQQGYQSDVAIIQLKENIEFNENVVPICLPNDYKIDVHALKSGMLGKVCAQLYFMTMS